MSECISPRWSKPNGIPLVWIGLMRSSYNILKICFAFELDCSSLGLILNIIAFLLCLAREVFSSLRLSRLVSKLKVPLNISSSHAIASDRSEVLPDPSTLSGSKSSPDPSSSPSWWRSGRINVCSLSWKRSRWVRLAAPASTFRPSSPSRFFWLLSFIPLTERLPLSSLVASH